MCSYRSVYYATICLSLNQVQFRDAVEAIVRVKGILKGDYEIWVTIKICPAVKFR